MNEKKLQAWAALAEIVSALAIIVSLLYVANEFRRSTTLSSRDVDVILFEREREANSALAGSSGMADVVVAALRRPEELSEADRLRYLAYQHNFFDSWEIAFYHHADGILDDISWAEWDEWFAQEAKRRPRFGWTENRHHFTGLDFLKHVDEILSIE